jgi:hypothetical protein
MLPDGEQETAHGTFTSPLDSGPVQDLNNHNNKVEFTSWFSF